MERTDFPQESPCAPPASGSVSLGFLKDPHCRWPYGDPMDASFRYCGATKGKGCGSYCQAHYPMAYTPAGRADRQASLKARQERARWLATRHRQCSVA